MERSRLNRRLRIFLCYAVSDKQKVQELYRKLQHEGFHPWLDSEDLLAGDDWRKRIPEAVRNSDVFIVCLSDAFQSSGYKQTEINLALDVAEEQPEGAIFVIPIKLTECAIPGRVSRWHCVSVADENGYQKLLRSLRERANPREPTRPWNIPGRKDFVGRNGYILQLRTALLRRKEAGSTRRVAIYGIAGTGKTYTAIEYAYRYRDCYSAGYWITADSPQNLVSDFARLGRPQQDREIKEEDMTKAAEAGKQLLKDSADWLLILDNVESWNDVETWIPQNSRGDVLITTQRHAMGTIAEGFDLPMMMEEEGAELLLRRARMNEKPVSDQDATAAGGIVDALKGLPLALDQAGCFIEEMGIRPAEALRQYLVDANTILNMKSPGADHLPVTATYTLAFAKLSEQAKDVVRLCAFLAPDAIPEEIFSAGQEAPADFHRAVADAARFSLIRRDRQTGAIDIHRVVQEVVRGSLEPVVRRVLAERIIAILDDVFPKSTDDRYWPRCEPLLAHTRAVAQWIRQFAIESAAARDLLVRVAWYVFGRAQYEEAISLFQLALAIGIKLEGDGSKNIAPCLNGLAVVYRLQERYKEAERLANRALEIREKECGPDNPPRPKA